MYSRANSRNLETAIKDVYRRVALEPSGSFQFETGRRLAEALGYSAERLNQIPQLALESFAGVGHHFELANLQPGERVLDLGSGSGTDAFTAATYVGTQGLVMGVDMTDAQGLKALGSKDEAADNLRNVEFLKGYLEALPFANASFDCVISNGAINLVSDKHQVFREAARVLRSGGRLALSDVVSTEQVTDSVSGNALLWSSCIGGAMEREDYQQAIEDAGFELVFVQPNPQYHFLTGQAIRAAARFDVSSISLLAVKR